MPHRRQPPLLMILLLAMGAGAGALAQANKATAADTPLALCAAANRQALLELSQATQDSQRRNVIHPLVVTRLQGLQAQLGKLREGLPRTSRNLAECELAGAAIAAERERLLKLAGPDPEVAECMASSRQMHGAVARAYEAVQRSRRLPAGQNADFEASGSRLDQIGAALARDGLPAADCRQLVGQIALERTRVEGWMSALGSATAPAPPAAPAERAQACRADQARSYNELAQSLTHVAQGPPLQADRLAVLHALSDRLTRLRALLADPAAPGWDCEQVGRDLAQVRAELQPLLPPVR